MPRSTDHIPNRVIYEELCVGNDRGDLLVMIPSPDHRDVLAGAVAEGICSDLPITRSLVGLLTDCPRVTRFRPPTRHMSRARSDRAALVRGGLCARQHLGS